MKGLLYVEQILRYLGSFTRETQISQALDSIPNNVMDLYEIMLGICERRLAPESAAKIKSVITWLCFSTTPLKLSDVNTLCSSISEISAAEILDVFRQFFKVERIHYDNGSESLVDMALLFSEPSNTSSKDVIGEHRFEVKLRDRSMKAFFGTSSPISELRGSMSDAHRLIFLESVQMICDQEHVGATLTVHALNLMHHLAKIEIDELSFESKIEIFEAFNRLITSEEYPESIRRWLPTTSLEALNLVGTEFDTTWLTLASAALSLPLRQELLDYWQDKENALEPLLLTSLRNWLKVLGFSAIASAYKFARVVANETRHATNLENNIQEQYLDNPDNVRKLAIISDSEMDSSALHALGTTLFQCGDIFPAIKELEKAIEMCSVGEMKSLSYLCLAQCHSWAEDFSKAIDCCDLALEIDSAQMLSEQIARDVSNGDQVSKIADATVERSTNAGPQNERPEHERTLLRRRRALQLKGKGQYYQGRLMEAAKSFSKARKLSQMVIAADDLHLELMCHADDPGSMIDTVLDFDPLHRLHLLTDPKSRKQTALTICRFVAKSKRYDDLRKVYREVIKTLDSEQAGTPLRVQFAETLWTLQIDVEEVKALLNQVLDSTGELQYKLTGEYGIVTTISAAYLISKVLQDEFRKTKNGQDKYLLFMTVRDLQSRNLPATGAGITLFWIPVQMAVARMLAKIGSMLEYEQAMKGIFNLVMQNLTDSEEANDPNNILYLALLLMMMTSAPLHELAEIVISAIYYRLESNSMDENQEDAMEETVYDFNTIGPSTCDGKCDGSAEFSRWDEKNRVFFCLVCPETVLCQECYDLRMKLNADPAVNSDGELYFCCPNGRYLTGPAKGWRGVKNGVFYFDPDEESNGEPKKIEFKQLLKDIECAWEKAWEEFWVGA